MAASFEPAPGPAPTPLRPPGLEMARGLLYFAMVFMVFMFLQMAALIGFTWQRTPAFRDLGFSMELLDSPAFADRWLQLANNGDVLAMVTLIAGSLSLLLLLALVSGWKGPRIHYFLGTGAPKARVWFLWTAAFILLFAALEAIGMLLPELDNSFMEKVLSSSTRPLLLLVGLGLAPGLFEEFLLRGLLYGSLRHLLDKHVAVAITAGVFTLMHQQYEWYILLLYVLPLGVFLGYARASTGSIWVAVFLHVLNNCVSIAFPQLG